MAFQPASVRDLDTAQDQLSPFGQAVHVIADSAAGHQRFRSITPFDAMMLYLSFMSVRGRISTLPPAVSTRIHPAATSHKLIPCSMYASSRPQATYAMSSAALPS